MKKTRASVSMLLVGLLTLACVGVQPQVSIPPIVIPTLPPINIPSLPPINIPSGLLPSGLVIPTIPPIQLPSGDPSAGLCPLVTPAEVSAVMGSQASITESEADSCTYTFSNFSSIIITRASGSDLTSSRFLFGETAKDVTVGGLPGLTGVFIGQPAVHVQRGTDQLQIQGILTGSDDPTIAKLVQIATTAVSRWP